VTDDFRVLLARQQPLLEEGVGNRVPYARLFDEHGRAVSEREHAVLRGAFYVHRTSELETMQSAEETPQPALIDQLVITFRLRETYSVPEIVRHYRNLGSGGQDVSTIQRLASPLIVMRPAEA
jgi:hypothetical protein